MKPPDGSSHLEKPWGRIELTSGSDVEKTFGTLSLRLRRVQNEVWLRCTHDEGTEEAATTPHGGDIDWMRWSVRPTDTLDLLPSLPDRPVVVSPELPFFLPPRSKARVFVRVPLFVRALLEDESGATTVISDVPSLVLSDTWVGTFTEGALGYWLTTTARRVISRDLFEPHLVMCPLLLRNQSDQPLPIERFAVRVSHLSLFIDEGRIWADEVQVRYEGSAEGSEIKYTGTVPDEVPNARPLALPREEAPRGLRALTFGLRQLSGFGG